MRVRVKLRIKILKCLELFGIGLNFVFLKTLQFLEVPPGNSFTILNFVVQSFKKVVLLFVNDLPITFRVGTVARFDPFIIRVVANNFD
jgi:hypothetical protein